MLRRRGTSRNPSHFNPELLSVATSQIRREKASQEDFIRATVDVEIPGRPVALPLTVWSTFREWREHPTVGPQLEKLLASRGGIRGRMADLLSDETGQDSVLNVPMQSLLDFPGVPLTADDAQRLVTERHNDDP
jgi:beta-glucosidase